MCLQGDFTCWRRPLASSSSSSQPLSAVDSSQLPALGSRLSDLGSRLSSRLAPGFLWSAELRTKTPGGKCIRSSALSSSSLPRRESNSPVIALARHSSLCLLGLLESVRTVESARSKHPLRLSVRLFLAAPFPPCPSVRPSVRLAVR